MLLLLLVIAYLFLICPNRPVRDTSFLRGWWYAHRGLHDNRTDAPENSLRAFRLAVENGYGIEFDVQLTRDGRAVVFHDDALRRVCGVAGRVQDYTYAELQQFRLLGTDQRIPLFTEVLELVDGRVPLIIELKAHGGVDALCREADRILQGYAGPYCVESFHSLIVRWYAKNRPEVIRGQLSGDFNGPDHVEAWYEFLVHHLLTNFATRPDFIAYDHRNRNNLSRRLCRPLGALSVAWTVKSQAQLDACRSDFDLFIFEGFRPLAR